MAQNESPCWLQFVGALGQIVTWILVIVGWVVVNRQHNQRETRKELRAQLDKVRDTVFKIEGLSETYHTDESPSGSDAKQIKILIQRVGAAIDRLMLLESREAQKRIIALRQAITLHNFDTRVHKAQGQSSEIIANINSSVDALLNDLESKFQTRFF